MKNKVEKVEMRNVSSANNDVFTDESTYVNLFSEVINELRNIDKHICELSDKLSVLKDLMEKYLDGQEYRYAIQ